VTAVVGNNNITLYTIPISREFERFSRESLSPLYLSESWLPWRAGLKCRLIPTRFVRLTSVVLYSTLCNVVRTQQLFQQYSTVQYSVSLSRQGCWIQWHGRRGSTKI